MKRALFALVLVAATPALADGNPGDADPTLLIGPLRTFPNEPEARAACRKDPVVWADRYAGYYYYAREPEYGTTHQGAYACLREAQGSNYWGTGPLSSMAHQAGRTFPFTSLFVGS